MKVELNTPLHFTYTKKVTHARLTTLIQHCKVTFYAPHTAGFLMSLCQLFKITCLTSYYQLTIHIKISSIGDFCAVS